MAVLVSSVYTKALQTYPIVRVTVFTVEYCPGGHYLPVNNIRGTKSLVNNAQGTFTVGIKIKFPLRKMLMARKIPLYSQTLPCLHYITPLLCNCNVHAAQRDKQASSKNHCRVHIAVQ